MHKFDDIRPYDSTELSGIIQQLINDEGFLHVVSKLYPDQALFKRVIDTMNNLTSIDDFQAKIAVPLLAMIESSSTKGISYSAMEQFNREENYLFVSNHRDIILDPAFLNYIMHRNGFRKTEIAIGDNLLIFNWIKLLVRLNRSFIVKRNLGIRDQLNASKTLSGYIRYALTHKKESVWIAQREGRSKDGNDITQPALLKMLNMSNKNSLYEGIRELNIVPMAISYEIEPCGIAKVEELLKRKYISEFAKTQQDDLQSMARGIMNPKGRVHFGFGNPVNIRLKELVEGKNNSEAVAAIANYIDRRIYFNYKLWPNNYIAYDLLNGETKYISKYTSDEKEKFVAQMESELATIQFDQNESMQMYLAMYANPVVNFEKHFGA